MSQFHTIKIEALTSEGEGIGSLDGLKVFVDGALPKEQALISIQQRKKHYAIGKLQQILSPSPERVAPPCPYFAPCGGCQLMHMTYEAQLQYKQQKVRDALRKIAHLEPEIAPCVPSPERFAYRNKVQLPLIWKKEGCVIGFFKKRSHEIIPIKQCLIQTELGNRLLRSVQQSLDLSSVRYVLIKTAKNQQKALLTFVTTGKRRKELAEYATALKKAHPEIEGILENINRQDNNVILTHDEHLLVGNPYITEFLLDHYFQISSQSFFQVNPKQAEQLFAQALALAEITSDQIVVDGYCGVGTLAILAASYAKQVIGIELSPAAILQAKENALRNGIKNCTFYAAKAEKKIEEIEKIDTLFINPPRKGCEPSFLTRVSELKPTTLIYISCNPATLARDLTLLPDYQISHVIPFDMFPQTTHVETLVKLKIKK